MPSATERPTARMRHCRVALAAAWAAAAHPEAVTRSADPEPLLGFTLEGSRRRRAVDLVYAPRPSYEAETLPGLREAVEAGDAERARRQSEKLAAALRRVAATLEGVPGAPPPAR